MVKGEVGAKFGLEIEVSLVFGLTVDKATVGGRRQIGLHPCQ